MRITYGSADAPSSHEPAGPASRTGTGSGRHARASADRASEIRSRSLVPVSYQYQTCPPYVIALPAVSGQLGNRVRTNCESLIGVRVPGSAQDLSKGIAIGSGFYLDQYTHIEATRYPAGS